MTKRMQQLKEVTLEILLLKKKLAKVEDRYETLLDIVSEIHIVEAIEANKND